MNAYKERAQHVAARFEACLKTIGDSGADMETKEAARREIEDLQKERAELLELKNLEQLRDEMIQEVGGDESDQDGQKGAKFGSWGEFLASSHKFHRHGLRDSRLRWYDDNTGRALDMKDMVENVGASGGFLVPAEFRAELYAIMAEQSFIRGRASIIPMRRRQIDIPVLDQTSTETGIPHWFGGMQFYWAEEASEKTETDASFRKISLIAHKLFGYTRASDELISDAAVSLAAFLTGPRGFAGGAVWMEEYAFLQGSGAGQPQGIINAGATIVLPRQQAGNVVYDDIAGMMQRFLPSANGVFIISQSLMSQIITLSGPTGSASYIWHPSAREGLTGYLMGYPVIWTEKLPIAGQQGDILLADVSYYLIGDRQAATVESTQYDRWRYDQTSWRMVHRVDGQPWLSAPLTYADGVSQVSPFVVLGGPAAT